MARRNTVDYLEKSQYVLLDVFESADEGPVVPAAVRSERTRDLLQKKTIPQRPAREVPDGQGQGHLRPDRDALPRALPDRRASCRPPSSGGSAASSRSASSSSRSTWSRKNCKAGFDMRKTTLTICLALVLGLGPAAALRADIQAATDESLFREAKLLVFDKSWKAALDKIDELIDKFPSSPLAGQALFYKGECLSGLGGRERDALRAYKSYIRLDDAKPSLVEESEGSIVDLAFDLYEERGRGRPPGDREPAGPREQGRPLLRGLQAEPRLRQEGGGQGRARPVEDRRDREGPRAPRPGPHRAAPRLAREPEDRPRTGSPGSSRRSGCSGSAS